MVKSQKKAIVQSIKSKEKVKQKPQALNTVEMLRVASSALNIGPQQAMQVPLESDELLLFVTAFSNCGKYVTSMPKTICG